MITLKGWNQNLMVAAFEKEATYNAGKTITTQGCSLSGFDFGANIKDEVTKDIDEVTGYEHGNTQEITAYANDFSLKFPKAKPNDLAFLAALALGSCASTKDGANDGYTHVITPVAEGTALPSTALVHKVAGIQKQYKGIKCGQLTLAGEEGKFLSLEATLIGSGTRASDAQSFVAKIAESWIKMASCLVFLETGATIAIAATRTQAAEDISSGTPVALKARMKNFKFTWDNKPDLQPGFGGDGVLQDIHHGRRAATLAMTLRAESTVEEGYFTGQLACAVEFDWKGAIIDTDGTLCYGAHLIVPRAMVNMMPQPKGGVNDALTVDLDFDIKNDGTNPAVIIEVYNKQAAYLAAPA